MHAHFSPETGCGSERVKLELWDNHSELTGCGLSPAIRTNFLHPDRRVVGTRAVSHLASSGQ